jgi:hypothetical protein
LLHGLRRDQGHVVSPKDGVTNDERYYLNHRLTDQQSIKGILVMLRELCRGDGVTP